MIVLALLALGSELALPWPAVAEWRSDVAFRCQATKPSLELDVRVSSIGEAEMIVRPTGGASAFACPLELDDLHNGMRDVKAEFRFRLLRARPCAPGLPAKIARMLEREIDLRLGSGDRLRARLGAIRGEEFLACEIRQLRPQSLVAIARRQELRPSRRIVILPSEMEDGR
jgi:hypothetical protein